MLKNLHHGLRLTAHSCAIEMSMVASHLIWRLRTRGIRKRAKESGKTFDEFEEGVEWQAKGIDAGKLLKRSIAGKKTWEGESGAASVNVEALPIPEEMTPKTVPNATV